MRGRGPEVERSEHRVAERVEIVRLPRRDQVPIIDNLPIDPGCPSVLRVFAHGGPRRETASAHGVCLDQELRTVADCHDRPAALTEAPDEGHHGAAGSKVVGGVAAGGQQHVEVQRIDARRRHIDFGAHRWRFPSTSLPASSPITTTS